MSLFDIIKYSGTNLDSVEELASLPVELFGAYRVAAFSHYGFNVNGLRIPISDRQSEIVGMAKVWADDSGYAMKQTIFDKVLKEYHEPI